MTKEEAGRKSAIFYEPGTTILNQGSHTDSVCSIVEGEVAITCCDAQGTAVYTQTFGKESLLGLMATFWRLPLNYSVRTLDFCILRKIPRRVLVKMMAAKNDKFLADALDNRIFTEFQIINSTMDHIHPGYLRVQRDLRAKFQRQRQKTLSYAARSLRHT